MNSDIGDYEMEMNDLFSDDDFMPSTTENESDLMASMASFFLKLEATHGLSQTCVDSIVEEVDTLLGQVLEKLKKEIKCFMKDQILDHSALDTCLTDFQGSMSIFLNLTHQPNAINILRSILISSYPDPNS